jgi:hypothetical protein
MADLLQFDDNCDNSFFSVKQTLGYSTNPTDNDHLPKRAGSRFLDEVNNGANDYGNKKAED